MANTTEIEDQLKSIIKDGGTLKSTKSHAKLVLRMARMERFLSVEHPVIYKSTQDFLNTFEKNTTE